MRNRRIVTGALAAATLTVLGLGATQASAADAAATTAPAAAAQQVKPMDGPPGTVWTGKKYWTHSGCVEGGTELVNTGKWADPFCDGTGLRWDLWARPL